MEAPERIAPLEPTAPLAACIVSASACERLLRGFVRAAERAGPGTKGERELLRLMLDCAEVCAATASFARAGSVFLPQLAQSCLHLCDDCAAACERTDASATMAACAEACRDCARCCFALRAPPRRMPAVHLTLHR